MSDILDTPFDDSAAQSAMLDWYFDYKRAHGKPPSLAQAFEAGWKGAATKAEPRLVPTDLQDAAYEVWNQMPTANANSDRQIIGEALLSERMRCARLVAPIGVFDREASDIEKQAHDIRMVLYRRIMRDIE